MASEQTGAIAHPFWRVMARLRRDRSQPLAYTALKGVRFVSGRILAPIYLAGCDRLGAGGRVRCRPVIDNGGVIRIGDDVNIASPFCPVRLTADGGGRIDIGADVFINYGTSISAATAVTIGDHVSIGPYVEIADHDDDGVPAAVEIGDDVWLGARVRIRKGVRVGSGTVVAAGSVVTDSLPDGVVAGGNPAVTLRRRRDADAPPPMAAAVRRPHHQSRVHAAIRRLRHLIVGPVARLRLRRADRVGRRPRVCGAPHIENWGTLHIGDDFRVSSRRVQSHIVVLPGGTVSIGDHVAIGCGAAIASEAQVDIGNNVTIGRNVLIMDTDFHDVAAVGRAGATAPIVIEDGVRIDSEVIILKGSRVPAGTHVRRGMRIDRKTARSSLSPRPTAVVSAADDPSEEHWS